ncbi:MAG: dolichyl-phosphate beta-glucosyltransferase [Patescibacteria group bacterium]
MEAKKEKIYLSIVIPAYNEADRIGILLEAISKYERTKNFLIETIVVNNASTDTTHETIENYRGKIKNLVIMDRNEKGKGGAVHEGMLKAQGKYVIFADADNSTPIEQVDELLKYVDKYDVVIGSRYCAGGKLAVPQPLTRILGSRALNFVIQALAVPGIKDTQCGFKLFAREAAQQIFTKQSVFEFSFDIELLAIARKLGYKIKEAGITWYDNPHSTVNPLRDGLRMVRDAWKVRLNIVKGIYR